MKGPVQQNLQFHLNKLIIFLNITDFTHCFIPQEKSNVASSLNNREWGYI